jgi:hypothetical protein
MPRKRIHGKARTAATIADLAIEEQLAFSVFWGPTQPAILRRCCRWATWEEFDTHYAALRDAPADEWFVPPDFAESRYLANLAARKGG